MDSKTGGQTYLSPEERRHRTAAEIARKKVMAAYSRSSYFGQTNNQSDQTNNQPSQASIQSQPTQSVYQKSPYVTGSLNQSRSYHQTRHIPITQYQSAQSSFSNQSSQNSRPTSQQPLRQAGAQAQQVQPQQVQSQQSQPQTQTQLQPAPLQPISTQPKLDTAAWQKYHEAWQNYYQKYYSEYYAKAARHFIATEKLKDARAERDQQIQNGTESRNHNPNHANLSNAIDTEQSNQIEQSLKERIQAKASGKFRNTRRHRRLVPILSGVAVVLIILFMQYNRVIFAPIMAYISPGNTEDTGITAIDPTATVAPTADPRLIIPKLNIDVPVAFGISNDDATVNEAMNHGVAHFAIPGADAFPGQVGNTVITGHSAGDIYSSNPYKFIFSGLERLTAGDMIYVNYNSVRYTYSVTKLETVEPTNVAALIYNTDKPMLTLITCTPLGTSRYRLLVTAEQINPIPDSSSEQSTTDNSTTSSNNLMPANEPSFFEKIWNWLTGQ